MFFSARSVIDETFAPSVGATFGLYAGILIFCGLFCSYCTELFARLQTPSVILNVLLALVTIIGLPIARRHDLNPAAFTFTHWENLYHWPSGFTFFVSWRHCTR